MVQHIKEILMLFLIFIIIDKCYLIQNQLI